MKKDNTPKAGADVLDAFEDEMLRTDDETIVAEGGGSNAARTRELIAAQLKAHAFGETTPAKRGQRRRSVEPRRVTSTRSEAAPRRASGPLRAVFGPPKEEDGDDEDCGEE